MFFSLIIQSASAAAPEPNDPDQEIRVQYQVLATDIKNAVKISRHKQETYHEAALIVTTDQDLLDVILRRSRVLLNDIKNSTPVTKLDSQLQSLEKLASAIDVKNTKKRFALFKRAHILRRRTAFSNPLLNFDKILFIKRHRSTFNHMCDQYY